MEDIDWVGEEVIRLTDRTGSTPIPHGEISFVECLNQSSIDDSFLCHSKG